MSQGREGEVFLRTLRASCVRVALLTLSGMADLASMRVLGAQGFR